MNEGILKHSAKLTAKVKLTLNKRAVDALEPQDKPWIAWDDRLPGFGGRVYPPGSKVYVVQTRHRGKSRRVTLGRRRAALALSRIKSGQEPEEKAPGTVTVAVAELVARYLREHVEVRCKASTQRGGGGASVGASPQPAPFLCQQGVGAGGEPVDDREVVGPQQDRHDVALRAAGAGFDQGVVDAGGGQHRGGRSRRWRGKGACMSGRAGQSRCRYTDGGLPWAVRGR